MSLRSIASVIIFFYLTSALAQIGEAKYLESFQYDKRVHDFGTIREADGEVSHTFTFTNKGREVVTINDITTWCGCTVAKYSKEPVRPGRTTKVTLIYNPDHRPGKFSKEVVLKLNGGKYYTRLWVKGNVTGMKHPVTEDHPYSYGEGLYMSHQVLPFPPMAVGEEKSVRLLLANDTDSEMTVEFERHPNNRVLQFPERIVLKPSESTKIYARYRAVKAYSYRRSVDIIPVVKGKKLRPLKIIFQATNG